MNGIFETTKRLFRNVTILVLCGIPVSGGMKMDQQPDLRNDERRVDIATPAESDDVFPEEFYKGSIADKLKRFNSMRNSTDVNVMFVAEYTNLILGDMPAAIEEYRKVISEHGTEPLPMLSGYPGFAYQAPFTIEIFSNVRIAYCFCAMKRYAEAAIFFQKGYPWRPFYYESAECYRAAGDVKKAIVIYEKAVEYHNSGHWGSDPEIAVKAKRKIDLIMTKSD